MQPPTDISQLTFPEVTALLVPLHGAAAIVVSGADIPDDFGEILLEHLRRALPDDAEGEIARHLPVVIIGADISAIDEADMAAAGWVRAADATSTISHEETQS